MVLGMFFSFQTSEQEQNKDNFHDEQPGDNEDTTDEEVSFVIFFFW